MESRYETAQIQESVPELTKENAINYLVKVKAIFLYKKDKYNQFISTLRDFYLQRIDMETVVERVSVLLEGQEELIFGFERFLPASHKIKMEAKPREKTAQESALIFLRKIKACFGAESKTYKDFLGIMLAFKRGEINASDVISEVTKIFEGRPDLMEDFNQFHSW